MTMQCRGHRSCRYRISIQSGRIPMHAYCASRDGRRLSDRRRSAQCRFTPPPPIGAEQPGACRRLPSAHTTTAIGQLIMGPSRSLDPGIAMAPMPDRIDGWPLPYTPTGAAMTELIPVVALECTLKCVPAITNHVTFRAPGMHGRACRQEQARTSGNHHTQSPQGPPHRDTSHRPRTSSDLPSPTGRASTGCPPRQQVLLGQTRRRARDHGGLLGVA